MKKILFFSLICCFLLPLRCQVLPVFESGQRIVHISAGISPSFYCFEISHTGMGFDDIFGVENLNFGLTENMGFFISNPIPTSGFSHDSYGFSLDALGSLHYTVADRFALMGQAGLTLNSYEFKMFGFIYNLGLEFLITEQFGVFVKGSYLKQYKGHFGLFVII